MAKRSSHIFKRNYSQERERWKVTRERNLKALCLQDILLELMDEWKVSMAEIQRETLIPWGTLSNWIIDGKTPVLDRNILALSKFFNCSINYLAFGIGEEPIKPEKPEIDQAVLNKAMRES